jgi:anti-sigma regulatory factor (Ser/Thr protein kinase)
MTMSLPMEIEVKYVAPGTTFGSRAVATSLRALFDNVLALAEHAPELELVAAEAMNNVAIHSYGDGREGEMRVEASFKGGTVTITVTDRGLGLEAEQIEKRHALPQRKDAASQFEVPQFGRGLFIVNKIMDSVDYHRIGEQNRIQMTKKVV